MAANEFWTNADGLNIRFGLEKGAVSTEGQVSTMGDEQEFHISFDYTDVGSADSVVGTFPSVGIPDGAYITSATLYVTTAFAGATAVLDIGLFNDDGDGTFSANDANGIDAAIAVTAIDATDDEVSCDGALVGKTLSATGGRHAFVSVGWNTAAFTAGAGKLVVKYRL